MPHDLNIGLQVVDGGHARPVTAGPGGDMDGDAQRRSAVAAEATAERLLSAVPDVPLATRAGQAEQAAQFELAVARLEQMADKLSELGAALSQALSVEGTVTIDGLVQTGGLTDEELRATPISVDVDFPEVQEVSGVLTNAQLRQAPLLVTPGPAFDAAKNSTFTDGSLRGTVQIEGDVSTGALTDEQLRAAPLTVEAHGSIALDAPTLAALEQILVTGTVDLTPASLAALEQVVVSGTVALDAATLAALEQVTAAVSGTVALTTETLAALESLTATISGTVAVSAAELPLPTGAATAAGVQAVRDRLAPELAADGGAKVHLQNALVQVADADVRAAVDQLEGIGLSQALSLDTLVSRAPALRSGAVPTTDGTPAQRLQLEHYQPAGSTSRKPRYVGRAPQGTADGAATWVVQRLTWIYDGGTDVLTDLQTLTGSWTGRAALGWT